MRGLRAGVPRAPAGRGMGALPSRGALSCSLLSGKHVHPLARLTLEDGLRSHHVLTPSCSESKAQCGPAVSRSHLTDRGGEHRTGRWLVSWTSQSSSSRTAEPLTTPRSTQQTKAELSVREGRGERPAGRSPASLEQVGTELALLRRPRASLTARQPPR